MPIQTVDSLNRQEWFEGTIGGTFILSEKDHDRYLSEAETIREISRGVGRKHANDNEEVIWDEVDKVATDMIAAMHEKGFDVDFCQQNVNKALDDYMDLYPELLREQLANEVAPKLGLSETLYQNFVTSTFNPAHLEGSCLSLHEFSTRVENKKKVHGLIKGSLVFTGPLRFYDNPETNCQEYDSALESFLTHKAKGEWAPAINNENPSTVKSSQADSSV